MPQYKSLISLLFFIGSFFCCKAQDNHKYVYQDSTVQQSDSVVANDSTVGVADTVASVNNNFPAFPDTTLLFNHLIFSPDSVAVLKNMDAFAYAKKLDSLLRLAKKEAEENPPKQQEDPRNNSDWLAKLLASSITSIVLWTLVIAFILFLLYRLFIAQGSFLKGRPIRNKVNQLTETETDNEFLDYNQLITKAIYNKDYRLAIRYSYLYTLQNLSENGLIKLEAEKTNYQYINELGNTVYREPFMSLTLNYEYVWYGEFPLTEEAFSILKNKFEQFNNRFKK